MYLGSAVVVMINNKWTSNGGRKGAQVWMTTFNSTCHVILCLFLFFHQRPPTCSWCLWPGCRRGRRCSHSRTANVKYFNTLQVWLYKKCSLTIRKLLELIINRHHFTKYYCCSLASENLVCGLICFAGKTLFSVLNVYSFYAGKMKKIKTKYCGTHHNSGVVWGPQPKERWQVS